jgi:hypothetical protein
VEEGGGFSCGVSGVAFVVEVGLVGVGEVLVGLDLQVLLDGGVEGEDGVVEGALGGELVALGGRGLGGGELFFDVGPCHPEREGFDGCAAALGDLVEGLIGLGEGVDEESAAVLVVGREEEVGVAGFEGGADDVLVGVDGGE